VGKGKTANLGSLVEKAGLPDSRLFARTSTVHPTVIQLQSDDNDPFNTPHFRVWSHKKDKQNFGVPCAFDLGNEFDILRG
jgi:hypothetical protein